MNLVSIRDIYKSFGEKVLLKGASLNINDGDKIGLIGVNGSGKSTLLRIIMGEDYADDGKLEIVNKRTIEYLSQNPDFDSELTVLDQIFKGSSDEMDILREYEGLLAKAEKSVSGLEDEIIRLQGVIDNKNLWNMESEVKSILTKLKISDFEARMGTLSGGQRKRVALAAALLKECNLLILDEPTNHMDSDLIQWLEEYLNNRKGALLMITHDRYFLDRVTNVIVELDKGVLHRYNGNYSYYLESKLEREALESVEKDKREKLFKKELAWMRKGARARTTKQKARIQRFDKIKDSLEHKVDENLEISVATSRLGKTVIELKNISKSYGEKVLIDNFSHIFLKDDRVGIVGPNGTGKSTLVKIITDQVVQDSGEILRGQTVKIGYFSQENEDLDGSMRVIDYVKEAGEFLETADGDRISASKMLERFLFSGDVQYSYIRKLSGGEKRRLYLLRILMSSPNVLIFDEPTNDLDVRTLSILEDFLDTFKGPVITISHDRYFLDRICNSIFYYEGNGAIRKYPGNYSDLIERMEMERMTREASGEDVDSKQLETEKTSRNNNRTKKLKFSYSEKKEFEEIDGIIEDIENRIEEIEEEMSGCTSDYVKLQELMDEKSKLDSLLEEKMERWEYLNELSEEIDKQKNS
ncbi:ATP-binding cassette, subfamily F, uup [Dethiosulfatibacter aminovorans DSM 17477]|uniref:ATP-binding cassette, subfamily F, uup n=1 Tax=Dethiosulfatibacter aminovorans DSM 17477 TaxID=1121476 RepID=A0A1M6KWD7_9FIRM|nr:ABC-F family ATP-binding cassette domain-containing protein [Dethiosulfatibacter aminovorans]SHJ63285.1 ATP-binding cassette, subfamily F, uup [Dethiosulfatibacter aminovorans DSM 17477]